MGYLNFGIINPSELCYGEGLEGFSAVYALDKEQACFYDIREALLFLLLISSYASSDLDES